jgi:hypothetical protein
MVECVVLYTTVIQTWPHPFEQHFCPAGHPSIVAALALLTDSSANAWPHASIHTPNPVGAGQPLLGLGTGILAPKHCLHLWQHVFVVCTYLQLIAD